MRTTRASVDFSVRAAICGVAPLSRFLAKSALEELGRVGVRWHIEARLGLPNHSRQDAGPRSEPCRVFGIGRARRRASVPDRLDELRDFLSGMGSERDLQGEDGRLRSARPIDRCANVLREGLIAGELLFVAPLTSSPAVRSAFTHPAGDFAHNEAHQGTEKSNHPSRHVGSYRGTLFTVKHARGSIRREGKSGPVTAAAASARALAADPEVKPLGPKAPAKGGPSPNPSGSKVDHVNLGTESDVKGGNAATYLVRRLKRDAPDVAEELARVASGLLFDELPVTNVFSQDDLWDLVRRDHLGGSILFHEEATVAAAEHEDVARTRVSVGIPLRSVPRGPCRGGRSVEVGGGTRQWAVSVVGLICGHRSTGCGAESFAARGRSQVYLATQLP
jgi:hypothetical protein